MPGRVAALYRHPVKGFTPERLTAATVEAGACFPCDRLYAVENGASGYDPAAPAHLSKTKFAVLSTIPALARARTTYRESSGTLSVRSPGAPKASFALRTEAGREAFAAWLTAFIDPDDRRGELRVLKTAGPHRFMDDAAGAVSLLNLASVRDLAGRLGREVNPLRFRANLHLEGWPAWSELALSPGAEIQVGEATLRVVKPIVRCAATHVDPVGGTRDLDLVPGLHKHYGRLTCGLYAHVIWGGRVADGDRVTPVAPAAPFPPLLDGEQPGLLLT